MGLNEFLNTPESHDMGLNQFTDTLLIMYLFFGSTMANGVTVTAIWYHTILETSHSGTRHEFHEQRDLCVQASTDRQSDQLVCGIPLRPTSIPTYFIMGKHFYQQQKCNNNDDDDKPTRGDRCLCRLSHPPCTHEGGKTEIDARPLNSERA